MDTTGKPLIHNISWIAGDMGVSTISRDRTVVDGICLALVPPLMDKRCSYGAATVIMHGPKNTITT